MARTGVDVARAAIMSPQAIAGVRNFMFKILLVRE
jgi:hypothetical protein